MNNTKMLFWMMVVFAVLIAGMAMLDIAYRLHEHGCY